MKGYQLKIAIKNSKPSVETESTLSWIFNYYKKEDILSIAKLHGVPACTKYNKADLILHTVAHLLKPEAITAFFLCLRDDEIQEFEKAIAYMETHKRNYRTKLDEYLERISNAGYCGWDQFDRVILTADVVQMYQKINTEAFRKKRALRSFLLDCLMATSFLYGTSPLSIVAEMYNQNIEEAITVDELSAEIAEIPQCLAHFVIVEGWYIHKNLLEDRQYEEIKMLQGNLDYYIPTRMEIKTLAEGSCLPDEWELREIVTFFKNKLGLTAAMAEEDGRMIQRIIAAGGDITMVIDFINQEGIQIKSQVQFERLMYCLMQLWNNTRMILKRGFKESELSEAAVEIPEMWVPACMEGEISEMRIPEYMEGKIPEVLDFQMRRKQKVDPDAPCPCGSGIKYKYCCGKN